MRRNIIQIYQNLQESDLIQNERLESEKAVERICEYFKQKKDLDIEEIYNELYDLVMISEQNGFVAGFRYAVRLMKEC